jgi:hypothetical protein
MKSFVTTFFFLACALVACDQSIPTNPIATQDSDVQGKVMDTAATPAVKAAVVAGVFQNRVHFPPIPITDTFTEGDTTTTEVDTSSSDIEEEVDLGPPLPEDVPPPEVDAVEEIPSVAPVLCQKMAEVAGMMQGAQGQNPAWHHPGCVESTTAVKRKAFPMDMEVSFDLPVEPGTDELCLADHGWFEKNQCMTPYQEFLFPALEGLPEGGTLSEWSTNLAYFLPPEPKSSQELYDALLVALKLETLGPLFATGGKARLSVSTVDESGEWQWTQLVVEHPLLGSWNGVLLLPTSGEIKGAVLAVSGHEAGNMLVKNWLKGMGMTDYPKSGIAVLLMASRPYRAIGQQGVETLEPRLAYELWRRGKVPLASVLVIEHLLEREALKRVVGQDVPLVYIGHSGGASIVQSMAMAVEPAGVIADYPFSAETPWYMHMPQTPGGRPPHCETIVGAGGTVQEVMHKHSMTPYQIFWASDPEDYFHYELPGGHYLPPWELAVRRQVLLTMLGVIDSPVIPPPGG